VQQALQNAIGELVSKLFLIFLRFLILDLLVSFFEIISLYASENGPVVHEIVDGWFFFLRDCSHLRFGNWFFETSRLTTKAALQSSFMEGAVIFKRRVYSVSVQAFVR